MFHRLEQTLARVFSSHLQRRYGWSSPVVFEEPRQPEFGELALPAAFQLARTLKRPPRTIAEEIVRETGPIEGVAALEVGGAGYVNIHFDRRSYARALLGGVPPDEPAVEQGKIIVEHTNINPNKAAHIGHLRNAVLGDTFVRILRARGRRVEVQNYIDNTGVQVADVVAAFERLLGKTPEQVAAMAADPTVRFDYFCWDLYARISAHYREHPETLAWRQHALEAIERGEGDSARIATIVSDAILRAHLATMWRLDIVYDVLPRESEILRLKFWARAFELLRERGVIHYQTEGKNAGCWVMPAAAFAGEAAGEEDSKVIVRSNGTVTYVGKDIAYQLWKFGLLGRDFHYRPLMTYPNGHRVWVSSETPGEEPAPEFGRGTRVYNVIDSRQSYLQDIVAAGLRALGFQREAENSIHFAYEMVALSPRCAAELGFELDAEERRRAYVEVSGRKGLGVKADELIDKLVEKALEEVASRHPHEPPEQQRQIATQIAVGALRYFMLKYTRNVVIAFDFEEALSFEGETGPYVQYAVVRARSIFRKLAERGEPVPDYAAELDGAALERQLRNEEFWQLLLAASKADATLERAIAAGEPAHVAKYAFQLAQAFNNFYHQHPILAEPDRERKLFLLWLTDYVRGQLERTLGVLGIPCPEYM
ncbi:MAG: arginine--tRNA ligase [Bryobacterales bacterium]|nr:arginine--tRNA ligase [Bryobacteraceae bacterium]MDW8131597.1 arginine--tRNA ligase [Bryobacterales bacterium]